MKESMSKKAKTPDERFLVCIYEEALKTGDLETPLDKYAVGSLAGLHAKGIDAICKLLVQANFIKKKGEKEITLTPHGEKLVLQLLDEW